MKKEQKVKDFSMVGTPACMTQARHYGKARLVEVVEAAVRTPGISEKRLLAVLWMLEPGLAGMMEGLVGR